MGQKVSVSGINPACTCGSVLDYGEGKWYRCLAKVVLNYGQTGTAQKRKQIDADQANSANQNAEYEGPLGAASGSYLHEDKRPLLQGRHCERSLYRTKGDLSGTRLSLNSFVCPSGFLRLQDFTKVLKPFVASIRNKGIRLVIYLDDMAIISSSRERFIINKEKSVLIPSQKIVFLGYVIDSVAMTVSLPEEKLSLWGKPQCSIRELAHVIGLIVSSFPAIKPARLYYRDLEVCKLTALSSSDGDYNAIAYLSQLARDSLQWLVVKSHLYNGTRISKPSKV
ncbi:hypothetical protein P5673_004144 [Acropora cervicornis]|uniref:Reverse transcriptase domain-containing protein n=1 Tax=Acropora cervicornis TaxID=6130 RepID=A0AAD9R2C2_ACRCE|nr:hypothetical protein P5673_004144 [Acropora cervicornis]